MPWAWVEHKDFSSEAVHGSPVPPEQMGAYIEPRTCASVQLTHGCEEAAPPVVSATYSLGMATLRALVNDQRPELGQLLPELPFIFCRAETPQRVSYVFIPSPVMDVLLDTGAVGYLYSLPLRYRGDFYHRRADQSEVRFHEPLQWNRVQPVTMADMPPSAIVLSGKKQALLDFVRKVQYMQPDSIEGKGRHIGLGIRRSALWRAKAKWGD